MKKERQNIAAAKLLQNEGQLDWLPRNPRQWTQTDIDRTVKSITEDEDFLEDRPLLAVPCDGKYLVFAGNLRTEAIRRLKLKQVPVVVYVPEGDEDQYTIKRRAMKDNGSFGSWDYDTLANEWDDMPLADWGVPAWSSDEGEEDKELKTPKTNSKDEKVEIMLNDAMRENVIESLAQIELLWTKGWISSFVTKGLAQAKFLRAKYYGEHYPQWVSLYFCPERFKTSANDCSPYEQLCKIASGETDAGIAGLRTLSGDHLLLLLKGSYPFGGARMPMDFPANTARDLIEEFGGPGAKVLDPCHGWGGRLCGAYMADASLYVGVDPSNEAHKGLEREMEAFGQYSSTSVELIQQPFEDVDLEGRVFDMAITSPPYFDVEQYHGEGQSHERYPQYSLWVDKFYKPLIKKTYDALRPGGVFVLNVGGKSYPLIKDGKRIAEKVGFNIEDVRPLGGGTESALHNNTAEDEDNEKIIILRK